MPAPVRSESYVFLSHNTKDFSIVKAISDQLEAKGVTTWIDTERIVGGERFEEKIVAAMNQAKANVIFCGTILEWRMATQQFLLSPNCQHRFAIQVKGCNGRSSCRCQSNHFYTIPGKMLLPVLLPRIKHRNRFTCLQILKLLPRPLTERTGYASKG